jgi:hypothetical protein
MKGTLSKTNRGWVVKQVVKEGPEAKLINQYPLIDNGHIDGLKLYDSNEGLEIDFEIVDEIIDLGRHGSTVVEKAKLVHNWLTMKEGDITVNFKPMPEFDEPAYPTRLVQLKEQAWDVIYQEFIKNTDGISSLALLEYLKDNYNPPTKKQDNDNT